jgi:prepilin signal peptidase PulO-like enzyme (type II secretory pathway)
MFLLLIILGLIIGSFISALSWRFPKRISVVKGRSICPNCKHQISWYDNIPLLSYVLLGGKCRHCKKTISWRYPAIELVTAIGFLLIGPNVFALIMFCLLELIFIIDLEHQIIPDTFIFFGLVIVLLLSLITDDRLLLSSLFSGFLAASLLMLIHLFTRGRGMGLGDVKFAVLGGMLVGLKFSLIWLFLAFLTGGIVGTILLLGRKAGLKDKIAFGPFLVISIPASIIWGQKIIDILLLH